jgi:hypothetical protein
MVKPEWTPGAPPLDRPSASRMYDYFLGGHHYFEIDRVAAEQVLRLHPDVRPIARANRAFLRRAVTFLLDEGIEQILDLGSGIPTVGTVHEVAAWRGRAPRIVYVDNDPLTVAHSRLILGDRPDIAAIEADARRPADILGHPETRRLLDFDRPLGLLLVAVLHFVPDDAEAYALVRAFREALPPGSYVALSHATYEGAPREVVRQAEQLYARSTQAVKTRSRGAIAPFFAGLELVEPGLVPLPLWRPEADDDLFLDAPARALTFAGVGRTG